MCIPAPRRKQHTAALIAPVPARPPPCRSFPRGGGLQEWRDAFLLFINLPAPGESPAAAAARRPYSNQWLWLPPAGAEGAAAEPVPASGAEAGEKLAAGWRLGLTWWTGRGSTAEHPVVQRLLAAGAAGSSAAGEASGGSSGGGGGDAPQPRSVLLFCRAGSQPYVFCGRLLAAATDTGDSAGSGGNGLHVTWALADTAAMLAGGGSPAIRQLLQPAPRLDPLQSAGRLV